MAGNRPSAEAADTGLCFQITNPSRTGGQILDFIFSLPSRPGVKRFKDVKLGKKKKKIAIKFPKATRLGNV